MAKIINVLINPLMVTKINVHYLVVPNEEIKTSQENY
jgi:hypothetical protein